MRSDMKWVPNPVLSKRFGKQGIRRILNEMLTYPAASRRYLRAQLAAPKWRGVYT